MLLVTAYGTVAPFSPPSVRLDSTRGKTIRWRICCVGNIRDAVRRPYLS